MLGQYSRHNEHFESTAVSAFFGFISEAPLLMTPYDGSVHVFDVETQEQLSMREFARRAPRMSTYVSSGALNPRSFRVDRDSAQITTPYYFNADPNGVWIAAGGYHRDASGRFQYWIAMWDRDQPNRPTYYDTAHRWTPVYLTMSRDGRIASSTDLTGAIHVWSVANRERLIEPIINDRFRQFFAADWADDSTIQFGFQNYPGGVARENFMGPLTHQIDLLTREIEPLAEEREPTIPSHIELRQTSTRIREFIDSETLIHYPMDTLSARTDRGTVLAGDYSLGDMSIRAYLPLQGIPGYELPVAVGYERGQLIIFDFARLNPWEGFEQIGARQIRIEQDFAQIIANLIGHESQINSLSQSPDGRLLLSASADGSIRIWDLSQLRQVADVDFNTQGRGNQIQILGPNSLSAGLQVGDRVLTVDGVSFYESRQMAINREFESRDRVLVEYERPGTNGKASRDETWVQLSDAWPTIAPVMNFVYTTDEEWVIWDSNGYYDASAEGDRIIGWHRNVSRHDAAIFDSADAFSGLMHRPEIIDLVATTWDPIESVHIVNLQRDEQTVPVPINLAQAVPDLIKPQVIFNHNDVKHLQNGHLSIDGRISFEQPLEQEVSVTLRVKRNGFVLEDWKQRVIVVAPGEQHVDFSVNTPADVGSNLIEAVAYTSDEIYSRVATLIVDVDQSEQEPLGDHRLVVLSIGVTNYLDPKWNTLRFPADDAALICEAALYQERGRLYREVVIVDKLTNDECTRDSVMDALDRFVDTMRDTDVGLIFMAGHGLTVNDAHSLLLHDFSEDNLTACLPIPELASRLRNCAGNVVVAMDACQTTELDEGFRPRGPASDTAIESAMRALIGRKLGFTIFRGCGRNEASLEHDEWGHGAFSLAFAEAMLNRRLIGDERRGVSDGQQGEQFPDGLVDLSEIREYVQQRVSELTNGRQSPYFAPRQIYPETNLAIFEVIDEEFAVAHE